MSSLNVINYTGAVPDVEPVDMNSKQAQAMDVATLAELLHETAEHHDRFEKTHAKHNWWDWYAAYLSARQNGSSSEKASAAADRYMEETLSVLQS